MTPAPSWGMPLSHPLRRQPESPRFATPRKFPEVRKAMDVKFVQGGAPKIANLVYNSNNYGLWMIYL